MTQESTDSPACVGTESESLEERLKRHPDLKAKIETLLSVVENAEGDLLKANEAEQRVIEEIQQLGRSALQGWATRQNQAQQDEFVNTHPHAQRSRKKDSIGTPASEPSK